MEVEGAIPARSALNDNVTAVLPGDVFDNNQSQPGTIQLTAAGLVYAIESFKQPRKVPPVYPGSLIGNAVDHRSISPLGLDLMDTFLHFLETGLTWSHENSLRGQEVAVGVEHSHGERDEPDGQQEREHPARQTDRQLEAFRIAAQPVRKQPHQRGRKERAESTRQRQHHERRKRHDDVDRPLDGQFEGLAHARGAPRRWSAASTVGRLPASSSRAGVGRPRRATGVAIPAGP